MSFTTFDIQFPARCLKILQRSRTDHDVTVLLMAAAAGFVIPLERFDGRSRGLGGRTDETTRIAGKFESEILGTALAPKIAFESQLFADCELEMWSRKKATQTDFQPISRNKTVRALLSEIRNALAHGNVYVEPDGGSPVEHLLLSFEERKTRHCEQCKSEIGSMSFDPRKFTTIKIPLSSFRQFVINWLSLFKDETMILGTVTSSLKTVAFDSD